MLATRAFAAAVAAPAACADPAKPCPGFRPHDLSFPLPGDGVARAEVRSASFFAVILVSGAPCRVTERERAEAQALFPGSKVFSARFGCDGDVENNVSYTNVDPKAGFLAVHAGADRAAADAMLARVKATGRFPGANVRRMEVVFVYP
jgi:hypothetical protein